MARLGKRTRVPHHERTAEHQRLADSEARVADWKHWVPYLAERAWGTMREDYSENGDAWDAFPHDHNLCLAVGLWNGQDAILKERFFGLTGPERNHGEAVKEYYFYLDVTPTHSYMKLLYNENRRRGRDAPEFELYDALPQSVRGEPLLRRRDRVRQGRFWYRNNWSWEGRERPRLEAPPGGSVYTKDWHLGERWWAVEGDAPFLFTENETNNERLFGVPNETPFVKDGVHEAVVGGHANQVNPTQGSKVAAHVQALVAPGASLAVRVRFADYALEHPSADFDEVFAARVAEADAFYDAIHPAHLTVDERRVQRQAFYMIGLVIVDDQPVVRDGLRGMFTGDPRFKVLDVA
ncbi:glycoside hydrolase family 63 [Colletotrichum asianum]|uniref:Mannosyl-oligosaccharide glucosidase n=1 Tax=Colletotrichum asianum TaxID=702518 RepID=A0A8H3W037_9PEZI|nr:glycoside hydrolase family 63 [Colletotrichum asianum]